MQYVRWALSLPLISGKLIRYLGCTAATASEYDDMELCKLNHKLQGSRPPVIQAFTGGEERSRKKEAKKLCGARDILVRECPSAAFFASRDKAVQRRCSGNSISPSLAASKRHTCNTSCGEKLDRETLQYDTDLSDPCQARKE
ncbi:hypothetical protein RvY_00548 [Ramazzottius varieornatus]|uniref:Secreted protein n=1 Tax=Ramazzottius varieornatus TaxID=947166 RepID=A0A1D1UN21_RAMVA|nr:hypothetical protein RvY_00548 [Ramazzottius varieornatus]